MKRMVMGITLGGNLFGLGACVLLVSESRPLAFLCVIVAMFLDMLDGPLARKAGATSQAGGWLDALTDVCIYVLFPAIFWSQAYSLPGVVLAVFIGAGLFRLIRFTLQGFQTDKAQLFYPGMPVFYSQVLLILTYALRFDAFVLGALLIAVAALNVSLIPFVKIPVRVLSAGLMLYVAIVALRLSSVL
jgi:phosphatidylserine synthase